MRYKTFRNLKDEDFKRSTGVTRAMFEKRVTVEKAGLRDFGRTLKLIREDQLLLTLMYWREYRLVWVRLKQVPVVETHRTIYRVKHDLLDAYLCQQLKSPDIQMRLA